MEIIIGREPINNRLSISVGMKKTFLGNKNTVPNNISRAHCRLLIDDNGNIVLSNLKEENTTYVGDNEIMSKNINSTDKVYLGSEKFEIDVNAIIDAAKKIIAADNPTIYSLRPLEKVWNEYEKDLLDMQVAQAKKANKQRLQGILSLLATVCAFIEALNVLRFVILSLALGFAIYFFWQENKTGGLFAVKKNARDKRFQNEYVCPNPDCKSFKGSTAYITLKNVKSCPVCGCKYSC